MRERDRLFVFIKPIERVFIDARFRGVLCRCHGVDALCAIILTWFVEGGKVTFGNTRWK